MEFHVLESSFTLRLSLSRLRRAILSTQNYHFVHIWKNGDRERKCGSWFISVLACRRVCFLVEAPLFPVPTTTVSGEHLEHNVSETFSYWLSRPFEFSQSSFSISSAEKKELYYYAIWIKVCTFYLALCLWHLQFYKLCTSTENTDHLALHL